MTFVCPQEYNRRARAMVRKEWDEYISENPKGEIPMSLLTETEKKARKAKKKSATKKKKSTAKKKSATKKKSTTTKKTADAESKKSSLMKTDSDVDKIIGAIGESEAANYSFEESVSIDDSDFFDDSGESHFR